MSRSAAAVPEGDDALVGLEGVADVLGDEAGDLARVEAVRERAAHVGDPPEVLGEGRGRPDRAGRLDRRGGLVGQDREDSDVGEIELVKAQLRERDHARHSLVVPHRHDDHRFLELVRAGDRHAPRVGVRVGHEQRAAVGGDPAGEPFAHLQAEVLESDRLVAVVTGGHDRDEVVGLAQDVDPAGVVVDDRPDLVGHGLRDGADGRAAGHPGRGALGDLQLGHPTLGRLAGLDDLGLHHRHLGGGAHDLRAPAGQPDDDEAESEAHPADGDQLDDLQPAEVRHRGQDELGEERRGVGDHGDESPGPRAQGQRRQHEGQESEGDGQVERGERGRRDDVEARHDRRQEGAAWSQEARRGSLPSASRTSASARPACARRPGPVSLTWECDVRRPRGR